MLIRIPNFSGLAIAAVLLFQPAIAAGQSLLDDTRQLLAMADYDGALENVVELAKTYPIDSALVEARVYIEFQQYPIAESAARRAVSLDPANFDARFLLAVSLDRQGQFSKAKTLYRRAIDFANSEEQVRLVQNALRKLDSQRPVQIKAQVGLAPSTNFNKATENDEVDLVFGTAEITSADPRGDIGATYSLSAVFRDFPKFSFGMSGLFAENLAERQNSVEISFKDQLTPTQTFSARFQSRWVGQSHYQNRLALETLGATKNGNRVSGGFEVISYASDEEEFTLYTSVTKELFRAEKLTLFGEVRAKRHGSPAASLASWAGGVSVWATFDFGKFDANIATSLNFRDWDSAAALFPNARSDRDKLLSVALSPKSASFFGLKPVFRTSLLDRESNIASYEIQSQDFYIGYETRF